MRATGLIATLREKNARLCAEVRDLKCENAALTSRVEKLEVALDTLRLARSVLSKVLYGGKSERQKKEWRHPPEDVRTSALAANPMSPTASGTTPVETDVEAYENTIVRPRWRRRCDCPFSPRDVTARPMVRLFDTTPYGSSVWECMLYPSSAAGLCIGSQPG